MVVVDYLVHAPHQQQPQEQQDYQTLVAVRVVAVLDKPLMVQEPTAAQALSLFVMRNKEITNG
jgi:hypothetical protein